MLSYFHDSSQFRCKTPAGRSLELFSNEEVHVTKSQIVAASQAGPDLPDRVLRPRSVAVALLSMRSQIVQELRCRCNAGHEQMIARPRACHVEHPALLRELAILRRSIVPRPRDQSRRKVRTVIVGLRARVAVGRRDPRQEHRVELQPLRAVRRDDPHRVHIILTIHAVPAAVDTVVGPARPTSFMAPPGVRFVMGVSIHAGSDTGNRLKARITLLERARSAVRVLGRRVYVDFSPDSLPPASAQPTRAAATTAPRATAVPAAGAPPAAAAPGPAVAAPAAEVPASRRDVITFRTT